MLVGSVVKYNNKKEMGTMTELERLYRRFEHGFITTEEFEEQLDYYEFRLLKMYLNGEIKKERKPLEDRILNGNLLDRVRVRK